MKTEEIENFEIMDQEKNFFLQSSVQNNILNSCYIEKGELKLEIEYLLDKQVFVILEGTFGEMIRKMPFPDSFKLQRCQEIIKHAIIDYNLSIKA